MTASAQFYSAREAATRLGVSTKALRVYEARGLLAPLRTAAGWRAYGPDAMRRAGEIAALRTLGFSLAQIQRLLGGDAQGLEPALAAHQARLEAQLGALSQAIQGVRGLRGDLAAGKAPDLAEFVRLAKPAAEPLAAFELPWPWGGERFELRRIRPLNYIIGPLGSGKTRLARKLAEALPNARFLGLERLDDGAAAGLLAGDPALSARVEAATAWLLEDGASASEALTALLVGLEAEGPEVLVVDLIEQGLDQATQEAVAAHLRRRGPGARPLFVMTRSSAILDLEAVTEAEAILLCPANHSPPTLVEPHPGAPGYEAVATCLASPAVRARTEGMRAAWPEFQSS